MGRNVRVPMAILVQFASFVELSFLFTSSLVLPCSVYLCFDYFDLPLIVPRRAWFSVVPFCISYRYSINSLKRWRVRVLYICGCISFACTSHAVAGVEARACDLAKVNHPTSCRITIFVVNHPLLLTHVQPSRSSSDRRHKMKRAVAS